jgi:hypothetical protein
VATDEHVLYLISGNGVRMFQKKMLPVIFFCFLRGYANRHSGEKLKPLNGGTAVARTDVYEVDVMEPLRRNDITALRRPCLR